MEILNTLIDFEHENTSLDFKLEEYTKHKTIDLIKDVMSMANADLHGDKYIIIGMKPDSLARNVVGIGTITDAASLQQTIIDNIEPEVHLDYFPHHYGEKLLGIIKISKCDNRPYLMKKDFLTQKNSLKRGEGFIRMGTTQMRLFRSHFEQIYIRRFQSSKFSGVINVSFERDKVITQWDITTRILIPDRRPSSLQAKKIKRIIEVKVKELNEQNRLGLKRTEDYLDPMSMLRSSQLISMGGGTPYEERSITTLRKNLKNVTATYYDEDYFYIFEKNSEKLNIYINNTGTSYLKDVKLVLKIPKHGNLLLADDLPKDPENKYPVINSGYPLVEDFDEHYEISEDLGDLRQQLVVKAFGEPLRMFFRANDNAYELPVDIELFATNLDEPIRQRLRICVVANLSGDDLQGDSAPQP